jgi:NADH-quinone oxidoreductase subunit E
MSIAPLGGRPVSTGQPFAFTAESRAAADKIIAKYPAGRQQSAVMPLLDLAQRQNGGWLSREALAHVAEVLDMALIRVYEVATFYTMYNLSPVGRHVVQVCTTTPCWLRGSNQVVEACEKALGVELGGTTPDGQFTLREVECLGACVNAPMAQIGDDYYEDLDAQSMTTLIETLKRGETPKPGPQVDRQTSAPVGGATTLKDVPLKQGT